MVWPGHLPALRTSASRPRGPPEAPAHTEGTLWRPGRRVWVCVPKTVYLGAPAGEAVSPGQVCASLCLALTLSLGSCLDVRLGLCIPSSGVYPSVALFIPVSYVSPSLSPERLSCLLSLLVSFFVSLWIGLCMPRSPVALVSLSPRCVSICPRGRVSLPSL